MKVLQIIETAYRATLEEQDDTVLWITHAMKGAGGDLDVLLRGNATNYAVKGQDASGLSFGDWIQTEPPRIDEQLGNLASKGVEVFAVEDDLAERGVSRSNLVEGVKLVSQDSVAQLVASYDQIWHW